MVRKGRMPKKAHTGESPSGQHGRGKPSEKQVVGDPEVRVHSTDSSKLEIRANSATGALVPLTAELILDVISRAGAIFFRWDAFAGLTLLHGATERILGYSREELMGDPDFWQRVIDPGFFSRFEELAADFFVLKSDAVRMAIPFIARSGGRVWVEARIVPDFDDEGRILGFVGLAFETAAAPPELKPGAQP
jgi:PAS domain S-box-containing protein